MSDTLKEIVQWFEIAKPEPTDKDKMTQMGCHFEEVDEMVRSILPPDMARDYASNLELSEEYKNCPGDEVAELSQDYFTNVVKRSDLLDSLCDQIVTAMGVGYMMGFDMQGALAEVSRSNMSKFENGKAVFFDNGKIAKGSNYSEPDLAEFLGERND